MRKIFTFLSVVFIAVTVYVAYGTFQSAQQFEKDSIQRANQANALSQQIADAQALQQETSQKSMQNWKQCLMLEMQWHKHRHRLCKIKQIL